LTTEYIYQWACWGWVVWHWSFGTGLLINFSVDSGKKRNVALHAQKGKTPAQRYHEWKGYGCETSFKLNVFFRLLLGLGTVEIFSHNVT
jgi:hypothetical protein